jgi:hypothetical protein
MNRCVRRLRALGEQERTRASVAHPLDMAEAACPSGSGGPLQYLAETALAGSVYTAMLWTGLAATTAER